MEKGFIYVYKPTIYIRFDEIASVNFARIGSSSVSALTRTFDFEIELKYQTVHTFSNIANEEYSQLFDFANMKKLHLKNAGKNHVSQMIVTYGLVLLLLLFSTNAALRRLGIRKMTVNSKMKRKK